MIAIVDYGVGNLFSLRCSLALLGADVEVTGDPARLRAADKILLPGVGAFADAAAKLRQSGLADTITEQAAGKPLFGICLGMQLLFTKSLEYGEHRGLGLIDGTVAPLRGVVPDDYKVPHIGWNALRFPADRPKHPLMRDVREGDCVYFVHSYYATDCADAVIATADYGADVTAAVAKGNVMGTQFHPEKSGAVGLSILRAFCEL